MAEQQRIHPVDVEAPPPTPPPSAPLIPPDSIGSDKGDPAAANARRPTEQFPPYRRGIPVAHSRPPKKRGCCCKCLCWSICTILLFIVLLAATAGILYLVFDPKLPKYSVDSLRISAFTVDSNLTASASFDVTVTATNPNKNIGIYYEDGSDLSVWYTESRLAGGSFPVFYQGHQNITVLTMLLNGQTQMGSNLMMELQAQEQTGMVPLVFKADVPVRVKFGILKLWTVRFLVNCDLVVDNLNANNQIKIKSSSCKFDAKL